VEELDAVPIALNDGSALLVPLDDALPLGLLVVMLLLDG
jgi:hypothetical protein